METEILLPWLYYKVWWEGEEVKVIRPTQIQLYSYYLLLLYNFFDASQTPYFGFSDQEEMNLVKYIIL